jgi:hypothetical protein
MRTTVARYPRQRQPAAYGYSHYRPDSSSCGDGGTGRHGTTETVAIDSLPSSSPLENRRASENEDFGVRARRETGGKVVTFVEDFATQP